MAQDDPEKRIAELEVNWRTQKVAVAIIALLSPTPDL
jgi:hypothetical protein